MNILVCTIMRNMSSYFETYKNQIEDMCRRHPEHTFYLAIYENDSTDNTPDLISKSEFVGFLGVAKKFGEKLNTNLYGSVRNEDRVRNLARARNMAMELCPEYLEKSDIVLWVEPDVIFSKPTIDSVINNCHKYDIFSPLSRLECGSLIADSWATRLTDTCTSDEKIKLLGLEKSGKVINVWSTFNCLCSYNSKPFKMGARFDHINKRLNIWDCDTVVICEIFRELGFDNIAIDTSKFTYWS